MNNFRRRVGEGEELPVLLSLNGYYNEDTVNFECTGGTYNWELKNNDVLLKDSSVIVTYNNDDSGFITDVNYNSSGGIIQFIISKNYSKENSRSGVIEVYYKNATLVLYLTQSQDYIYSTSETLSDIIRYENVSQSNVYTDYEFAYFSSYNSTQSRVYISNKRISGDIVMTRVYGTKTTANHWYNNPDETVVEHGEYSITFTTCLYGVQGGNSLTGETWPGNYYINHSFDETLTDVRIDNIPVNVGSTLGYQASPVWSIDIYTDYLTKYTNPKNTRLYVTEWGDTMYYLHSMTTNQTFGPFVLWNSGLHRGYK